MNTSKKKISISYTIRATKNNIDKLKELDLITTEEKEIIENIINKSVMKWINR